ncbi:MAG: beta-ketoacyl-[acyl-carrier-protein] synthase family protein [Lentisphaerae bacterium]|nr:MAG: beta-ketoacyl-[acyl-carrier-protein] synthase family protein [Lentisphaerota bacterium]
MTDGSAAVLGIGVCCRAGNSEAEILNYQWRGGESPRLPRRFSYAHTRQTPVFEFDSLSWLPQYSDDELLLTTRFWLYACEQAIADAGLAVEDLCRQRVGVCMGTTVGTAMNNESFNRAYYAGERAPMAPITRYLRSNPASAAMRYFGFSGPQLCVGNACASGTDALGIGLSWLRQGLCDYVLAGGSDELCRVTYGGFLSLMNTAEGECRPFDRRRMGLNLGEGAAALLLCRDPAGAKGYVLGYGNCADGYHPTAPHPEGKGLKIAIQRAIADSGISSGDICLINSHGTGTVENDRVEGKVIRECFAQVPFISTKGYTGHTLGAAGALEAAFTIWHLNHGEIPGTRGFEELDPEIGVAPVREPQKVEGSVALSQSLAFGGVNSVVVLAGREYGS